MRMLITFVIQNKTKERKELQDIWTQKSLSVAGDVEFVEGGSYTSSVSWNARLGPGWQTVGAH